MSTGSYKPPDDPVTPDDILESRVAVFKLFNNETRQLIQIFWNGEVRGLEGNWTTMNLLPSGHNSLRNFVASLPPIACTTSEGEGLKQASPP
jgi:hypothetical protein